MVRELDRVVLTEGLPAYGLEPGDVGTIVLVHREDAGYEVEFATLSGETLAVASLFPAQVRPIARHEIAHARPVAGMAA